MPFWKKKHRKTGTTLEGLIKVRGARQLSGDTVAFPQPPGNLHATNRAWTPRGLTRSIQGGFGSGWTGVFDFYGTNRGDFYRWLRDRVPIISAGVWAWVRLCATRQNTIIHGRSQEMTQIEKILTDLNSRILEIPYGKASGFSKLTEAYFLELFTTGRFAGEVILTEKDDGIDHFRYIDPYKVSWIYETDQGWIPCEEGDDGELTRLDPERFYYGTLGTDISNPFGSEPLASIPFVAEVEQLMLEDMARSSHNAGTPRLQVKIGRPQEFPWEGENEYTDRANNFFQDTVNEFKNLEPDQNVFTWDDVEVTVVGGSGHGWNWRLNREQVIEDVITGLKLFPWVLGRTHKTTQNWVQSQFDLLMKMVSAHQKSGSDLIDWICNLELELKGLKATVTHSFEAHADPSQLDRMRAEDIRIRNVDFKVTQGYISKDEGARELGYQQAHQQNPSGDKD